MVDEVSSGVVTFRSNNEQQVEVLLLNHGSHLSHPKGHVINGETLQKTALRELKEETNLDLLVISLDPVYFIEYVFNQGTKNIYKQVHYFAGIIKSKQEVKLSNEHKSYDWLSLRGGLTTLTYQGDRNSLKKAIEWLKSDNSTPLFMARNLALLR